MIICDAVTKDFFKAVENDNSNDTWMLIAAGAKVNARKNDDETPLHYATRFNYGAIAKILIVTGADVNAPTRNRCGDTPLHFAAMYNHSAIAKNLIDAGADCKVRNYDGYTPLHFAAMYGHAETAEILIAAWRK